MRIGIHASNTRDAAGQFQFLIMVLDALSARRPAHDIYVLYFADENRLSEKYGKEGWTWVDLKSELGLSGQGNSLKKRLSRFMRRFKKIEKKRDALSPWIPHLRAMLSNKYKLDFILFPAWADNCWEWGVPFGFAVHDLQHRLQPEFPEISTGGRWAWRENFFSKAVKAAKFVLVDSEEGKKNVLQFYASAPDKIKILPPTVPSSSMGKTIPVKDIPQKFLFYPAQLWPHKNHYRIVEAIGLIKEKRSIEISVIFVGKAWPEWEVLPKCGLLAKRYGIENQIHHFGYVTDGELAALYAGACGLVMPTYFGPTNVPYLEAFYYGCPVIASDIPGIREQVGEAALLVDPKDTEAIAEAIYKIWTDENLRQNLIKNGKKRLEEFSPERFKNRLEAIVNGIS